MTVNFAKATETITKIKPKTIITLMKVGIYGHCISQIPASKNWGCLLVPHAACTVPQPIKLFETAEWFLQTRI
jgi:hypothetical protein